MPHSPGAARALVKPDQEKPFPLYWCYYATAIDGPSQFSKHLPCSGNSPRAIENEKISLGGKNVKVIVCISNLSPAQGRGPFSTGEWHTSELEKQLGSTLGQGGAERSPFANFASRITLLQMQLHFYIDTQQGLDGRVSLLGHKSPLLTGTAASERQASTVDRFREYYHDSIIRCDASTNFAVTKPSPRATCCSNCQRDRLTPSP